jgi:tetratricopeptide (TPR) repeat protein
MNASARSWVSPSDQDLAESVGLAKLAASLGQDDPEALSMAAQSLAELGGDVEGAVALIDRALALNPNSAIAWRVSGALQMYRGKSELAIAHLERSARLNPLDTRWMLSRSLFVAQAHFAAGRYEAASLWADNALHENPNIPSGLRLKAATCCLLGQFDEGREWVARLLAVDPDMTVSRMRLIYKAKFQKPHLEAYLDGLRKAGLPE